MVLLAFRETLIFQLPSEARSTNCNRYMRNFDSLCPHIRKNDIGSLRTRNYYMHILRNRKKCTHIFDLWNPDTHMVHIRKQDIRNLDFLQLKG